LLIGGSWIRLQNLPLLQDSTTGNYIPLALDPFYFLRLAETIVDNGSLPAYDSMRAPFLHTPFVEEILPQTIVFMYKIANNFNSDITIQFIDVIYPVIFFVLGIIVFFFLVLTLTNSKSAALISSLLLTTIPAYLYRTLAGFADHEAIGMFAFFLAFLFYTISLKFLDKDNNNNKNNTKTILFGLLTGFASAFVVLSWGGVANFVFLIIPLSFGIIWLIKSKKPLEGPAEKFLLKYLLFYITWFVSSILFSVIFGYSLSSMVNRFILDSGGLLSPALLLFIIVDYLLLTKGKRLIKENLEKFRIIYSIIITFILGTIYLIFNNQSIFQMIFEILGRALDPARLSRTGLTVAENAAPYLYNWINQIGKTFFWIFFSGAIFIGFNLAEGIEKKKSKRNFSILWIIMISSILFSRLSLTSLLDGATLFSKIIYITGILLCSGYTIFLYFTNEIKIKNELIFLASWLFITLITVRGAIRFFFIITPLFCLIAGYFITKLFSYIKISKDDLVKMLLWVVFALAVIGLIISSISFWNGSVQQAKYAGPSVNVQWQESMSWVRDNTPEGSVFVHWWDYGYWVEYLGERPSVTDGGHVSAYWDHLVARYLLTTTSPETAFSFMKTQNVSYLLIDQTDIGKYPAYSKIGSDDSGEDRYSWIPTMIMNPLQTSETKNSTYQFYQGGSPVDQDIYYNSDEGEILLPANKAALAGIILETSKEGNIKQVSGVFSYKQKQISIPLRYVYFNNQLIDLGIGLDVVVYIFPKIDQAPNGGLSINNVGALMYFSQKNMRGLFVQNYILDNAMGGYENLVLVHVESEPTVKSLNLQGANVGEIVYFNGLRGPIKIWKVNHAENIEIREEFLSTKGGYAELDNLQFIK